MDRCTLKFLKPFHKFEIHISSSPKTLGYASCFNFDKTPLLIYQTLLIINKTNSIKEKKQSKSDNYWPANLSVNQSTNRFSNQAINHSSQPSTNLSANQWIKHKSLRNKSTNQNNHQSLHQSTMPSINQTTIKTKRVETLPGNLVMKTHDMILLTFPSPHPRQCWSPNKRKDDITIQHCFGKRWGEELSFFLSNFCLRFFSTIFSRL